jgi:hypothetical protein
MLDKPMMYPAEKQEENDTTTRYPHAKTGPKTKNRPASWAVF